MVDRLRAIAIGIWIELLSSFRSRVAIPFTAAFLIAIALCTTIDLVAELGKQIATSIQLHRYVNTVVPSNNTRNRICFVTLCIDSSRCYFDTPILVVENLNSPCIGRDLYRSIGFRSCTILLDSRSIEVNRICTDPNYDTYVVVPLRMVPNSVRCTNISFIRTDVVEAIALYVAEELGRNLMLIKAVILASYTIIVIPVTAKLLRGLEDSVKGLRFIGIPIRIAKTSIAIAACILAIVATALGVSVATIAVHIASTIAKAIGIYVPLRPIPNITSMMIYIAYSASIACILVSAMARGIRYA